MAIAAVAALAMVPTALAGKPGPSCPASYDLTTSSDATATIDQNRDGLICVNPTTRQMRDDHTSKRR